MRHLTPYAASERIRSVTQQSFLLAHKLKEFLLETGIMTEVTPDHGIDHAGLRLFHTTPFHAVVLSLSLIHI